MAIEKQGFPTLVKEVRRQLGISQEELAHEPGGRSATINRWENGKTTPFKPAVRRFCAEKVKEGRLDLSADQE